MVGLSVRVRVLRLRRIEALDGVRGLLMPDNRPYTMVESVGAGVRSYDCNKDSTSLVNTGVAKPD